MIIEAIDVLSGLRAALTAPEEQRLPRFRERVMEPLRPFWEPFLASMPQPAWLGAEGDEALAAARAFGYFTPEEDVEEGLDALDLLERAGAWEGCQQTVARAAAVLRPAEHGIALERVALTLVLAQPRLLSERHRGYTGVGGQPGLVMVLAWPSAYNLPRLPAATAHEFHHNVRLSVEPWTPATTVGQYVVLEGLAEAFAVELCGEETLGPWANALSGPQLAEARRRIAGALEVTGFDEVRAYVFGDWAAAASGYEPQGLPDFAGYTVGYRLVRAYLERSGRSAAEATYLPWREIVAGSGYL